MVAVQGENDEYNHYDVHNLYGWSQTLPTLVLVHSLINSVVCTILLLLFIQSVYKFIILYDSVLGIVHIYICNQI